MMKRRSIPVVAVCSAFLFLNGANLSADGPTHKESDLVAAPGEGANTSPLDLNSRALIEKSDRSTPIDKASVWRAALAKRDRGLALKNKPISLGSLDDARLDNSEDVKPAGFGFPGACCHPQGPDYACVGPVSEADCLNNGGGFAGEFTSCASGICQLRCEDSSCDWCWVYTSAWNNCPSHWNGDGSCDCGCQFCDSDCPSCGGGGGDDRACCGPNNHLDECVNGNTPAECLALGGAPQSATTCGGVSSCIRCVDECDWCWFDTAAEGNCPLDFFGDGECDCGCQFCDPDCESCGPCCSPSVNVPECFDGVFVDECHDVQGRFEANALFCSEAQCLPCLQASCDWCWIDTILQNNCDPSWEGDGECDCGCQFCDPDCPECGCPLGTVTYQLPPPGVVDARIPLSSETAGGPQTAGIIVFNLEGPAGADDLCWSLCTQGPPSYQNDIALIFSKGNQYTIIAQEYLAPDSCTVLSYVDSGGTPYSASYCIHPGNVDANGATNSNDVAALIGYMDGITPPYGPYSTDIDRSGKTTPNDVITLIDIINGAGDLDPWLDTTKPACGNCLPPERIE